MMSEAALAIIIHQLLFQGLFLAKNIVLRRKLGRPIRGSNKEANASIAFFVLFIALALYFASGGGSSLTLSLVPTIAASIVGYLLMAASLVVAIASLWHLGDSWRVGVIEEQQTQLVKDGIYGVSRNPYFLAYLLMFAAYTVFLQNVALLALSFLGFILVHSMVRREEAYLERTHGDEYLRYKEQVPRYLPLRKM